MILANPFLPQPLRPNIPSGFAGYGGGGFSAPGVAMPMDPSATAIGGGGGPGGFQTAPVVNQVPLAPGPGPVMSPGPIIAPPIGGGGAGFPTGGAFQAAGGVPAILAGLHPGAQQALQNIFATLANTNPGALAMLQQRIGQSQFGQGMGAGGPAAHPVPQPTPQVAPGHAPQQTPTLAPPAPAPAQMLPDHIRSALVAQPRTPGGGLV